MNSNYLLLALLMVLILVAGFLLGRFSSFGADYVDNAANVSDSNLDLSDDPSNNTEGTTVPTSSLTEDQRKMLSSFGINPDNLTITPEMIACAEAELGEARLQEIQNGATPSFTEGMSLLACYR